MKIQGDTRSVYIISNNELNRVKIGFSNNVESRFNNIRTQSGCIMTLEYYTDPIINYSQVEKMMHKVFKKHRYIGEWFNITIEEAVDTLKQISQDEPICEVVRMYKDGWNATLIASTLGVSRSGVVKHLHLKGYTIKTKNKKRRSTNKPLRADHNGNIINEDEAIDSSILYPKKPTIVKNHGTIKRSETKRKVLNSRNDEGFLTTESIEKMVTASQAKRNK